MRTADDKEKVSEMPSADEDALRAIRAASTALQEWTDDYDDVMWPEGESPRSWQGVKWSGDRVQELNLSDSGLEVLPPQIGQLTALTKLYLGGCEQLKELPPQIGQLTALTDLSLFGCNQLKELPPQIGQLLALTRLFLDDCDQLTLAPGAKEEQPAQDIVAAYARLLIAEPRKVDAPGELHAFLLANPLAVPTFFKHIVGDLTDYGEATSAWLCEAIKATPELANLTAPDGRSVTDVAEQARLSRATAKPDEDALRAIRAASTALQEKWLEGESPRSYEGVEWSGDRVQELELRHSGLEELPPQIGQLTALTNLDLEGCKQLKELPPQIGQLLVLTYLDLRDCEQLTLAPGAEEGQPAQTIVAAYAPLLIVAPHKDAPGELLAFLRANPLVVAPFFGTILTDAAHAAWLGEAVTATPKLAEFTDTDGRRAIDVAVPACKQAMQAALFLLGRFDVDDGPLLHRSATAAVAAAADHGDPEAKPVPRVALKAMRGADQVRAELEGRLGLDSKHVVAVKAVFADKEALAGGEGAWKRVKEAAAELEIDAEVKPDLSNSIQAHFFNQKYVERPSAAAGPSSLARQLTPGTLDASSEYKFILVLELADRSLATALMHDRIAANEWHLVRKMGADLARGLDSLHANRRIHADFKPLNICRVPVVDDNFTTFFDWELIDFDVSCPFGNGFGSKLPSSGYCPPEMAKVLLKAIDPSTGKLANKEELSQYKADVAYDLWSFGVVLFHLGTGKSLWHTNQDDSISQADLSKLANWDAGERKTALGRFSKGENKTKDEAALQHLVCKLLEPDREQRLKHFESDTEREMQMVLQHPFFDAKSLDDATLQTMSDQIKEVEGKLDVVIEMGREHRIELQHAFQVLLRGIFEATEVKTPTTFIILDEVLPPELSDEEQDQLLSLNEDGSGIELAGSLKVAKERLDTAKTWLERLKTFGEGVTENNPSHVFGKIKEVFGELMTKETMYFYLVDELTGLPVRGDGYPIEITKPSELVPKLLPVMQVGMRAMSLYNGVAGVAQMVGYPVPKVPEAWRKGAQSSVEMLKQESSVEKFGAVHAKVQEGDSKQETTRGASLRELQHFFEKYDKDNGYAGLRRIADEDGTAVWTLLKETEVAAQLEKRAGERREEELRRDDLFSALARMPSEAKDSVDRLREELEAAQAQLEAARAELELQREPNRAGARGVTEAAQGDKPSGGCCSVL